MTVIAGVVVAAAVARAVTTPVVDTDATAVEITLNGTSVALVPKEGGWNNTDPIDLRAGTLYAVSITVQNVKDNLVVRWQTAGRGWEIVPAPYLYSATLVASLRQAYVRFLKAAALVEALKLTAAEIVHFAAAADWVTAGRS